MNSFAGNNMGYTYSISTTNDTDDSRGFDSNSTFEYRYTDNSFNITWDFVAKHRHETDTLKILGKLSDIEIYFGINPEHDYIFVAGWNDELEDIYAKHLLYKLPNANQRDDNLWVITGSTDDFKAFIDTLEKSPNYEAISTVDDIINDFVMKELEE